MSSDAIRQRKRERTKRLVFGTHTYIIIHTYIDHSTRILHANTRKIMNADEKKSVMTSREISIPTSFLHFRSNFDESQFWPCCMKLSTLLYFFDASTQFLGVSSIFFCIGADELLASFLGEDKETCSFS
jgi:hypothetical protein